MTSTPAKRQPVYGGVVTHVPQRDPLFLLRLAGARARGAQEVADRERSERDRLALEAVSAGHTWRAVADAGGFANPYIAALKRKARS